VLAVGQDPLPGAAARYQPPARAALPRPERLAPAPAPDALPRLPWASGPALAEVKVVVYDLDPALQGDAAGIATFLAATGGEFRWRPLADGARRDDGALVFAVRAPLGAELTATLASASDRARHGYLTRRVVTVAPDEVVPLSGARHTVRFDLPEGVEQAGPLRIQRTDDRDWLPLDAAPAGLKLARGRRTSLQLGAGRYELQDPLVADDAQQFEVPAEAGAVIVRRPLARAPGARR